MTVTALFSQFCNPDVIFMHNEDLVCERGDAQADAPPFRWPETREWLGHAFILAEHAYALRLRDIPRPLPPEPMP